MPNFNSTAKSFIFGLSDFWNLYFKEFDQIEALYKGVEILAGQTYLDLLGLLLNSSVHDTPLYSKEYFKLLTFDETDFQLRPGMAPGSDRWELILPEDIVTGPYLNNRIMEPNATLERGIDYAVNADLRSFRFKFDPTNAYYERTFGTGNGAIRIRSRLPGSVGGTITVTFTDAGTPLAIARVNNAITITYDGPSNTGTTTAAAIVQALNLHIQTKDLVLAEVVGLGTGTATVPAGVSLELRRAASNSLDGFAARNIEKAFGGSVTDATMDSWIDAGVDKGDILRIIDGAGVVGAAQEYDIDLVRGDTLYVSLDTPIARASAGKVNYAVLRAGEEFEVVNEPLANSGSVVQLGADGTVTGDVRTFDSPTALFLPVHQDDLLSVVSASNTGTYRILSVVDANTVVLGGTAFVDETPVNWSLLSIIDAANTGSDGVLAVNGDRTGTFTSVSAAFIASHVGKVIRVARGSNLEHYTISGLVSANVVTVSDVATGTVAGVGLDWGLASGMTPAQQVVYSPPLAWPVATSVEVIAKRAVDQQVVQQGRDYEVSEDTGRIRPITVWRTSNTNSVSYQYKLAVVENLTPLQTHATGTLTPGTTNVFTDATATFDYTHIGAAIQITNSGLTGATNNGIHYIAAVNSPTSVNLSSDRVVPSTADPSNGAIVWNLLARGTTAVGAVSAYVTQMSAWMPDALVDKFHLYNTYGYLINRWERSSEEYRSLIKGLFQLFMLGPTLERFESAINTVAGLPVIRTDGEILQSYSSGALDSGADGVLDAVDSTFTSPTAAFTYADVGGYIYIASGVNSNSLLQITDYSTPTEVVVSGVFASDTGLTWEFSRQGQQTVTTSKETYTIPRRIPVRDRITDSSNWGLLSLRAFEVLTDVFKVTDYVETPLWWENAQIPEEIMPGQEASRRQSSPELFENVVNPADGACIGDPGFIIGADDEGFIAPSVLLRDDAGALDGVLTGDPLFPASGQVYFSSPTGAFTTLDKGNLLVVNPLTTAETYRIAQVVNAFQIRVESFLLVSDATGLDWEVRSGPLAKRHKMAFVVMERFLKHHMFSVEFDLSLSDLLSTQTLADLTELVFVAKPTYTYIVVTPFALFKDIIHIDEDDIEVSPTLGVVDVINAEATPLLVIGSSWRVGAWFRNIENTDTFAAPALSIAEPLGTPDAGYAHYVNKFKTTSTFTSGGIENEVTSHRRALRAFGADAEIEVTAGEATITLAAATFLDTDVFNEIRIFGATNPGNNGYWKIGAVESSTVVHVYIPAPVAESGLSWQLYTSGSLQGRFSTDSTGRTFVEDLTGFGGYDSSYIGNYVRVPFSSNNPGKVFVIREVMSASRLRLATLNQVDPIKELPDAAGVVVGDLAGGSLTVTPGDIMFSHSMCRQQRQLDNPSTRDAEQYYVVFTGGVNTGERRLISSFIASNAVQLIGGALTSDAAAAFHIEVERHYASMVDTDDEFEIVQEDIVIDDTIIDMSTLTAQDVIAAVDYTAYGVREPIDPSLESFDDSLGDTYYSIGMANPRQARGKSRTGLDADLREDPIMITVT